MGLAEKYTKSLEALREFQAERLAMEVTELIYQVMDDTEVTRAELASRLGKSRPYMTRLLDGNTNMTVRTIADVFAALGRSVRVVHQPLSVYTPRLLITEIASEPKIIPFYAPGYTSQPSSTVLTDVDIEFNEETEAA